MTVNNQEGQTRQYGQNTGAPDRLNPKAGEKKKFGEDTGKKMKGSHEMGESDAGDDVSDTEPSINHE